MLSSDIHLHKPSNNPQVHAIIFSVPSFCSQFVCLDSGSDNSSVRRAIGGEIGVRDRVVRTIVEVHTLHTHLTRTLRIQHGTHLLLRKSIAYMNLQQHSVTEGRHV